MEDHLRTIAQLIRWLGDTSEDNSQATPRELQPDRYMTIIVRLMHLLQP
jgi:hypothetical protein